MMTHSQVKKSREIGKGSCLDNFQTVVGQIPGRMIVMS